MANSITFRFFRVFRAA